MNSRAVLSWCVFLVGILGAVFVLGLTAAMPWWWGGIRMGVPLLLLSLVPIRSTRLAWKCDLIASPLLLVLSLGSLHFVPLIGMTLIATVLLSLLAPGVFWLITSRKNWPFPPPERTFLLRVPALLSVICLVLFFGCALPMYLSFSTPWWPLFGDCGGHPILEENGAPHGLDFTAHMLFVPPPPLTIRFYGRSLWAVARVEQRFSAPPTSVPKFIILRGTFDAREKSEDYFVEGRRSRDLLMGTLPIIEPLWCGHSKPLAAAQAELRILADGPPKHGARIIGTVYSSLIKDRTPVPGVNLFIEGPQGIRTVTTDAYGVFDANDLPPGEYRVGFASDKPWARNSYNLKAGQIAEPSFYLRSATE